MAGLWRDIVAGELAGQPEVERESQGVDIGTGITPASGKDLGRGVIRGPGERAGCGDPQLAVEPGRSEIRQPVPAIAVEQDILRLDVAVEDAVAVGGAERGGDVAAESNGLFPRQGATLTHPNVQVRPVDVLHQDEAPRAVFHEVVDRHDVLVGQAANHLDLSTHPLPSHLRRGRRGHQQLQRHLGVQVSVMGEVYDGIAAPAQLAVDGPAAANRVPGREVRVAHGVILPSTSRALDRHPSSDR